ncbi:hypothetical protein OOJ91_12335 [Micromonospora lupini]|uniref:hypothetical protein n=1 Tax=Micromonospora lupini TaxID=285679 RepID=UPI0022544C86|nr:hypothetical protein [Micromonospora lupini]MCX5066667.1 hypothetical protein [Micromonospora lupini]
MATLNLTRVWINLMSTGEPVAAFSTDRARRKSVQGENRTYGGGRRRSISQVGVTDIITVTLRRVTTAQRDLLEQWLGREVMYRDYRGQRAVGVLFDLDIREYKAERDLYDVATAVQVVTWVEGA